MAKHAVVRTDSMIGTDARSQLVSIKYIAGTPAAPKEIDNGNVLKVGALMDGEREVHVGGDVAAADSIEDIVLIATPELMYDERLRSLDDFYNEAGKICRGYRLHSGDIFSVTEGALTGTKTVGDAVELAAGTVLNSAAAAAGTKVGEIIAIDTVGQFVYYVIRVA